MVLTARQSYVCKAEDDFWKVSILYFWEITASKIASSLQMLPGSTPGTFHASVAEAPGGFQDFVIGCEVDGVRVGCSELPDGCTS